MGCYCLKSGHVQLCLEHHYISFFCKTLRQKIQVGLNWYQLKLSPLFME